MANETHRDAELHRLAQRVQVLETCLVAILKDIRVTINNGYAFSQLDADLIFDCINKLEE
jgi:hypothetical protein